ncbi:MAG TPA: PLP-dependent aminotransferase family protein [Blastocatellia bacterium]|nr:PLP-dependent aminotransferase family protein [Blastocatellia bacterium]
MEFHVSLVDRKDLSGEIYRQFRRAIVDGRLRPGELLPPSRELARRLSVARTTVTVAYDRLASEGFVSSRVGAGTFVNEHIAPSPRATKRLLADGPLRPLPIWDSIPLSTAFAAPAQFDFRTGIPDASLFPHDRWRRLLSCQLRPEILRDAVYGDPAGHRDLREAIAHYIGVARGVEASADDVTIVSGTQQALDVVARTLLEPGDEVAVEDPGYQPIRWLLESLGVRVSGVPVDQCGLIVEALPRHARLVYVTPSHQYPLGVSMALARRRALLAWAEQNHAAIVEDDYDSEFRFEARPIEPLKTIDNSGRVIYVGSFSKTMLPTLRLGFLVTPPSLRAAVQRAKQVTDWHTSLPLQMALACFIDDGGFARHVRKMRNIYRVRHDMVTHGLSNEFADHLQTVPSTVGLHVAALARTASVDEIDTVVRRASEAGVEVQTLSRFAVHAPAKPGLVLGYGAIPAAKIEEGLRRLRLCLVP